jgi:hypothetical protein
MSDREQAVEIERLLKGLSAAKGQRTALRSELQNLAAMIPQIRGAFGNPFFYSHPEHADESSANYTGFSSHEMGFATSQSLRRVDREIRRLTERLRQLGVSTE